MKQLFGRATSPGHPLDFCNYLNKVKKKCGTVTQMGNGSATASRCERSHSPFGEWLRVSNYRRQCSRSVMEFKPKLNLAAGVGGVDDSEGCARKKLGLPKIGVLVTLMNCARSSTFILSVSAKRFATLRSAVARPGPRKEPMPQVPNCPGVP